MHGRKNIKETIRLNKLCWFGNVHRTEENKIPKRVLYMNLGTTRLRGRPRNRWQDEVTEVGRVVGGEGWQINGRKWNCMCWFGHVQRMEENRIVCVGLDMYREWKKVELYVLVR